VADEATIIMLRKFVLKAQAITIAVSKTFPDPEGIS
jgi:hypothetical protein